MPIPAIPCWVEEPARLSQRMLLKSLGLLNTGAFAGSVRWSWALFLTEEIPAGAGCPLLVGAVAVVMFLAIVLLAMVTLVASSRAMPPPSCSDTLFVIVLSYTLIASLLAIISRTPAPSSLDMLAEMKLWSMVTGPVPAERPFGGGSSPASMMPPPSSTDWLR